MAMGIINHNPSAINALRILERTNLGMNKNLERLSSGLRINRAADDAAGLAVSEKMRAQIGGLDQAERNSQDAISMIQTAEGVLDTTHSILQRMRKLAVQAATDNYTTYDRQQIQKEMDELIDEIDRIAEYTEFNTKTLLNGDCSGYAKTNRQKVVSADVTGKVVSADYSVTVIDAGVACSVRGNIDISDVAVVDGGDTDIIANLRDLGIFGSQELHIQVDGNGRVIDVNENDTLEDVKRKINTANIGVIAGLDAAGDDLTMTSVHSGSRFNISFGDDPDGVAVKLGLIGGASQDNTSLARVTGEGLAQFVSGTDTIIEIQNITNQSLFPTDPNYDVANVQGLHLGFFRSNSRFFGEQELGNAINENWMNNVGAALAGLGNSQDLTQSHLLKGLAFHVDEDITYGICTQGDGNGNVQDVGYTAGYDTNVGNENSGATKVDDTMEHGNADDDINGNQILAPEPAVPTNRVRGPNAGVQASDVLLETWSSAGAGALAYDSVTSCRISVRDQSQVYHIGASEGQTLTADFGNIKAEYLGLKVAHRSYGNVNNGMDRQMNGLTTYNFSLNVSVETQKSAEHAITTINDALFKVSEERSKLGAYQNSLEKSVDYLGIAYENMVASESRIRDVDMAKEMTDYTRNQILIQSGTAMLAQANVKPQTVLQLLR